MVSEDAARAAAEEVIATWSRPVTHEAEIVVWKIEDHARAWVLHFATRRWLRTRDFRDLLGGSCPIVVDKASGRVHLYGSAPAEYEKFLAWLDEGRAREGRV